MCGMMYYIYCRNSPQYICDWSWNSGFASKPDWAWTTDTREASLFSFEEAKRALEIVVDRLGTKVYDFCIMSESDAEIMEIIL